MNREQLTKANSIDANIKFAEKLRDQIIDASEDDNAKIYSSSSNDPMLLIFDNGKSHVKTISYRPRHQQILKQGTEPFSECEEIVNEEIKRALENIARRCDKYIKQQEKELAKL